MPKKLTVLSAAMTFVALAVAGMAVAADDKHGPAGELMEKIQKSTNNIRKAVRTPAQWKKDASKVAEDAAEIEKLAKDSKKIDHYAKELKKPVAEWEKLCDDLIKSSADLASLAKKNAGQPQAKEAFNAVNKSCTACHGVFRVEE